MIRERKVTPFNFIVIAVSVIAVFLGGVLFWKVFVKEPACLELGRVKHLAVIMDGNRRWARQRGLPDKMGHKGGAEVLQELFQFCLDKKVGCLSLYTFSLENQKRSDEEKEYLFSMIPQYFQENKAKISQNNIKVVVVGDRDKFPESVVSTFNEIEELTKNNEGMTVAFMFCYGGRQEILSAVRKLCKKVASGELCADEVDEVLFKSQMWTCSLPDPDLLLRTGKRCRTSNFLPWQIAYSEIDFVDCYWPDINREILDNCYLKFINTERTFGC